MSSLKSIATVSGLSLLSIAPVLFSLTPASAQPTGLEGSYMGVLVDQDRALDLGLQALQESEQPASQILNEVLGYTGVSRRENSASPNQAQTNEAIGNSFQGRLDLPNSPISVRGTMFVGNEARAVMPSLSYDVPVADNANVYAGAGYSFVQSQGQSTPLGERNSVVLTTGVEAAVGEGMIVYGDARVRVNGRRAQGNSPVRLQVGAGYRF